MSWLKENPNFAAVSQKLKEMKHTRNNMATKHRTVNGKGGGGEGTCAMGSGDGCTLDELRKKGCTVVKAQVMRLNDEKGPDKATKKLVQDLRCKRQRCQDRAGVTTSENTASKRSRERDSALERRVQ